ncbi:response regulator [Mucilaginibacter ginsenosidivorans]|uniref:Response regulator n=1 Tax=Mucilaginibacter ginsenosidivorans TaxID=398053 RepID=A0A5B8UZR2_9SPHI|nr:response regulator [Mucilaginibacter ginsenosidivorans]QEC63776.1 response regulator [Mucilaginibacter ginsenosidivorans]
MRKKILIVDDDHDILEVLQHIAVSQGVEPVAKDSHVTLAEIEELDPALILLDHMLPIISGGDICRQIKSHASIKHIPVVLISAVVNLSQLAAMCGADFFLSKPFDLEELTGLIRSYAG